jgi:hypothetical protein
VQSLTFGSLARANSKISDSKELIRLQRMRSDGEPSKQGTEITYPGFLISFSAFVLTSIGVLRFEAINKGKRPLKGGHQSDRHNLKGEIMNLSVETKVAIAVATSFVVLMVGAMAQG